MVLLLVSVVRVISDSKRDFSISSIVDLKMEFLLNPIKYCKITENELLVGKNELRISLAWAGHDWEEVATSDEGVGERNCSG